MWDPHFSRTRDMQISIIATDDPRLARARELQPLGP